jgi:hypothetical protein
MSADSYALVIIGGLTKADAYCGGKTYLPGYAKKAGAVTGGEHCVG